MPTLRCKSPDGVDLQRASTGRGHRRQQETEGASVPPRYPMSGSQLSAETAMTEPRTVGKDEKANEASGVGSCCNACTSTLWRSYCVTAQPTPVDSSDAPFHSSREQLILEPKTSVAITPSWTENLEPPSTNDFAHNFLPSEESSGGSCRGADNPTFVSDDTELHHSSEYVRSNSGNDGHHDHMLAAQTLMQPVNGNRTLEPSDKDQTRSDAPVELTCYSLSQNGNRLVIEDLDSDNIVVSDDTTALPDYSGVSRPPWDVREAWPDKTNISAAGEINDFSNKKQLPVCAVQFRQLV